MTLRRILFRCDAGTIPVIGTGHLSRCLLLAETLREKGCELMFCGSYDEPARRRLESTGVAYTASNSGQTELELLESAIERLGPHVLLLDRLDTERELVAAVRELVPVVITLDDLGPGAELADIVVNGIVGDGSDPYDNYRFLVLPPPRDGRAPAHERPRVVLAFGGYDHGAIGRRVAEAVHDVADAEILWLVGGADGDADAPPGVRVLVNAPDFGEILATADIAVVAGGLTVFEALANGIPAIAVPQYEHQDRTIRRLARRRAVVPIDAGDDAAIGDRVRSALSVLLADGEARAELRRRALEVVDGHGLERVANLCLVVEQLAWDSSFFAMPIATIYPRRLNERLLAFVLAELERLGIECAYYLADSDDPESIRLAESAGFHFVDVRLTFERSLDDAGRGGVEGIRDARRDDVPALEAIAGRAYKQSRYFFDRHFDRVACERFYSNWVRKCVTGELPARVFVIDDELGPAGYIALTHLSASTSSIVLVGVADRAQGRGVGRWLVSRGLQWATDQGRSRMEVVTQGRNYNAQRLYQRCGFVTARAEVWYHWWSRR